jgi:hypothetical protein
VLLDVATFRHRTVYELDHLVEDLERKTHRGTPEERKAWRSSLPKLAHALSDDSLQGFHLHVGRPDATTHDSLVLEYRLPASPCWADAVLLGQGERNPAAVIIELKDWNVQGDRPGTSETLVRRAGREMLHPSDQVRGYTEYCRRFHSAIQEADAEVHGCVLFTYASNADAYLADPHRMLVESYPLFASNQADLQVRFPEFLRRRLLVPNPDFARRFEAGTYRQDRGFVQQISAAIRRPDTSPFVLLDGQREGFARCVQKVNSVLKPARASVKTQTKRSVVLIQGPPGSGKSAIAAQLWATLGADESIDGNVVLTTTSVAQRTNWERLFERASGQRAARGVVVGANQYNPGLNQAWLGAQRDAGHASKVTDWRDNLARFNATRPKLKCPDRSFAMSIVDEAHALIDPTAEGKSGISASGWLLHAGPQAWHVIRASQVSIFLLDPQQSYRDNETTTPERIRAFASELDAEVTEISLEGAQYRCGGSAEYVQWLDGLLAIGPAARRAPIDWQRSRGGPFEFRIVDDPQELEDSLRPHLAAGRTARLLASYARKWRTKGVPSPHHLPESGRDFVIPFRRGTETRTWSRIWNYAPEQDYTIFIQAPEKSETARDPLCEVGCPYVVRGFDFDYVGLLWLNDLVWRKDRWQANLDAIHESAWRLSLSRARKGSRPAEQEVVRLLQRGYRILLSRAIRGAHVWFEDDETRDRVEAMLTYSTTGPAASGS